MIAAGNRDGAAIGKSGGQRPGRTGNRVHLACHHQYRVGGLGQLRGAINIADRAHTGGQRDAILVVLIGKGPEGARRRMGDGGGILRQQGLCNDRANSGVGQIVPLGIAMQVVGADTTKGKPLYAERICQQQMHGDEAAHRIAEDIGSLQTASGKHRKRIPRHDVVMIGLRRVRLSAVAMAAAIHGDNAPAGFGERIIPARILPILEAAGGKTVNEKRWRPLAHAFIGNAHAVARNGKLNHDPTFAKGPRPVYDAAMQIWLFAAAINGFIAVAAGAFAAHGLQARLDAPMLEVFETGARYQMYHALALGLTALALRANADKRLTAAAVCFLIGIILFSGSLYVLALSGITWLGAITPLGGVAFLAGWGLLAWSALKRI